MDVAIIGASGDCGRQIATQLVAERVLAPNERLQLVGRAGGPSAQTLYGFCSDLSDAFAEVAPELDVALHPEEIVADIIVMVAGLAIPMLDPHEPTKRLGGLPPRESLVQVNLPLFETYARAIAKNGQGDEVVLVVTNPVELGVEIFSHYLGRHRVIGIGAYSDTLRFRREIASELGVRRQLVSGFVVGEHSDGMVPLWSTVRVHGMEPAELRAAIRRLRGDHSVLEFPKRLHQEKANLLALLDARKIQEAFDYVDRLSPDLRVYLKPYITHLSGAKTVHVTAVVVVDMLKTLLDGRAVMVAGQVRLDGEFYELHGPLGVPILVTPHGWTQVVSLPLWEDEVELLTCTAEEVNRKIKQWLGESRWEK